MSVDATDRSELANATRTCTEGAEVGRCRSPFVELRLSRRLRLPTDAIFAPPLGCASHARPAESHDWFSKRRGSLHGAVPPTRRRGSPRADQGATRQSPSCDNGPPTPPLGRLGEPDLAVQEVDPGCPLLGCFGSWHVGRLRSRRNSLLLTATQAFARSRSASLKSRDRLSAPWFRVAARAQRPRRTSSAFDCPSSVLRRACSRACAIARSSSVKRWFSWARRSRAPT